MTVTPATEIFPDSSSRVVSGLLPTTGPDSNQAPTPTEVCLAEKHLRQIADPALSIGQLIESLIALCHEFANLDELWLRQSQSPNLTPPTWTRLAPMAGKQTATMPRPTTPHLSSTNLQSWVDQHQQSACELLPDGQAMWVATPVRSSATHTDLLLGRFTLRGQSATKLLWLFSMIGTALELRQKSAVFQGLHDQLQVTKQWQQRSEAMAAAENRVELGIIVANLLKQFTGSAQVAVALADFQGKLRLEAISDVEQFDPQAASITTLKQAMGEFALGECRWQHWQLSGTKTGADEMPDPPPVYRRIAGLNHVEQVICWPFKLESGAVALGVLSGNWSPEQLAQFQAWDQAWNRNLSLQIQQWLSAHQSPWQSLRQRCRRMFHQVSKRTWLAAILGLGLLLAVPVPSQLDCISVLEPTLRKYVSTPVEGILSESFVLVGDTVVAGQVLAKLDGAQVRIELAGLRAEYDAARKKVNSALAEGNIAESQIAESETRRIQSKIDLLTKRLNELDVCSPIAGIVVSGDLTQSHGMPVQKGQVLFEIAPLEAMQVELQIPESEIRLVAPGQSVSVKLSAFPYDHWETSVERVQPRAELVDQANVFIAEGQIENATGLLRPGMKGRAQISIGWKSLAWNWFHRGWERLQYLWVW